jgi:hypothetical protein
MLNPLLFSLACLVIVAHALPEVKLGRTTISGRAVSGEVDFFGGEQFYSTA